MKPLIALLSVFGGALLVSQLATGNGHLIFAGNLAMCLMLLLTAAGHWMFTKGMTMMIPSVLPYRKGLVYLSGVVEALLGIALLMPGYRSSAAYALIVLFILLLPANIYAAVKQINMEKADYSGQGPAYLWFRIPEQLLFIAWVCYFSLGAGVLGAINF